MIFDFMRKLLSWGDDGTRKRKASDSSLSNNYVQTKRYCHPKNLTDSKKIFIGNEPMNNRDNLVLQKEMSSSRKLSNKKLKIGLNNFPPVWSSCAQNYGNETHTHYTTEDNADGKSKHVKNSALFRTHQLREKVQYRDLLQNFLPLKNQIFHTKSASNSDNDHQSIEVIELEKNRILSLNTHSSCRQNENNDLKPSHNESTFTSTTLQDQVPEINVWNEAHDKKSFTESVSNIKGSNHCIELPLLHINTLRDNLAINCITKHNFIPDVAKRYNERIEQWFKEVEELTKITFALSKQNQYARQLALEEQLSRSTRLYDDFEESTEEPTLPELTGEMMQIVKYALSSGPTDQILSQSFGLRITRKDIQTLSGLNWLNDEIINFYMNLLISRGQNENYPNVHAMNTFFYPKLLSGGHVSLKRWTRKVDIFAKDIVVIPIHLGIHWCMCIVDFRDKSIRYFDSMGSPNYKCLAAIRQYLHDESEDKKKKPFDSSDWTLQSIKDIPQQMNGSDCGVFSCMFAEYICANRKITFSQKDMPYFRNKMVYEILKVEIL